ncbi:MAG: hypothetical protein QMD01_04075 [Thermodesulfovibrionales bacterium]|nr:hypothetical protein [Thermodesulfovibrionales bacterium]
MFNWLVIIAIFLVLMALKLTKFIGVAIILALVVMLIAKNSFLKGRKGSKDL